MKLTPLADRVILKMVETEETTKGGIILTGSAKEKPSVAEVISVGPGGTVDGKEVTMTVKPGDKVITSQYAGTKVTLEEVEYVVVRQNDILAIVDGLQGGAGSPLRIPHLQSADWSRRLGQPLAALPPYGCRIPLAGARRLGPGNFRDARVVAKMIEISFSAGRRNQGEAPWTPGEPNGALLVWFAGLP